MSRNTCSILTDKWADTIRELWRLTEDKGVEHGTTISGRNDPERGPVLSGSEESIQLHDGDMAAPVYIRIHTHPSNNVGFSEGDWRSFLTNVYQMPVGVEYPPWTARGSCVVAQRLGEEGTVSIRCTYLTDKGVNIGVEEQREYVSAAFDAVNENPEFLGAMSEEVENALGDTVKTCVQKVPLDVGDL